MYEPYLRSNHQPPQSPVLFFWAQMANMWTGMVGSMIQWLMGSALRTPAPGGWGDDRRYENLHGPSWAYSVHDDPRRWEPEAPSLASPPWPEFQLVVMQPPTRAPARVLLDLAPESDLGNLELLPLHDVESPARFIRGRLERADERVLLLRLEIQDGDVGNFYGSVFDRSRGQPTGYVRVTLNG